MKVKNYSLMLVSMFLIFSLLIVILGCPQPAPTPTTPTPTPTPTTPTPTPTTPEKVYTITASTYLPEGTPHAAIAREWFKELEKRTNGAVVLGDFYYGGALASADIEDDAIESGEIDFCLAGGYQPARYPFRMTGNGLFYTYSGYVTPYICMEVYNRSPALQEEFARNNVYPVYWFTYGSAGFHLTKTGVYTMEDMKGLQIRGIGEMALAIEALGAVAVPIPTPDIYSALQTGLIDGAFQPHWGAAAYRHFEVCKQYIEPGFSYSFFAPALINLDTYNSLPDWIKKEIDDLKPYMADLAVEFISGAEGKAIEASAELGIELYVLPEDEQNRWRVAIDGVDIPGNNMQLAIDRGYSEEELRSFIQLVQDVGEEVAPLYPDQAGLVASLFEKYGSK